MDKDELTQIAAAPLPVSKSATSTENGLSSRLLEAGSKNVTNEDVPDAQTKAAAEIFFPLAEAYDPLRFGSLL